MDYEALIFGLEGVIRRLTPEVVSSDLQHLQSYGYVGYMSARLRPLVKFVNQPEFIEFLKLMQKYTTRPSWFDLLKDFLITDPVFTDRTLENYGLLGLSNEFINRLIYSSGRPRVDFKPYLDDFNLQARFQKIHAYEYVLRPSTVLPLTVADPPDGLLLNIYVPINRYQVGMAGYLTCATSESQGQCFCGTFYYYEPESPFLLYAPRALVSWNKITACLDLGLDFHTVYEILYTARQEWIIITEADEELEGYPTNMGFAVEGATKEEQWQNVVRAYETRALDPTVHLPNMYAAEDGFDQLLCQRAQAQHIDMVILKYMTGETRVVTEILDTRDRKTSFENIIFPPEP